ncbi:MAG: ABC transporter permease, partial [Rhodoferax sp.]|nr:ABC transporter permease [Rhodoferax sp.]
MLYSVLLLALRSVRRNLLLFFLAIADIVIGVSAVITMVTLGNGATAAIAMQISNLGTNLLLVSPGQRVRGSDSFVCANRHHVRAFCGGPAEPVQDVPTPAQTHWRVVCTPLPGGDTGGPAAPG